MRKEQRFEEEPKEMYFPKEYKPLKTHDMRPYSKSVELWIEELKEGKNKNSLEGLAYSKATLGEQFEKLKKESVKFETFPDMNDEFYFLLGTQPMTFICKSLDGKVYKVKSNFEPIKSEDWPYESK